MHGILPQGNRRGLLVDDEGRRISAAFEENTSKILQALPRLTPLPTDGVDEMPSPFSRQICGNDWQHCLKISILPGIYHSRNRPEGQQGVAMVVFEKIPTKITMEGFVWKKGGGRGEVKFGNGFKIIFFFLISR